VGLDGRGFESVWLDHAHAVDNRQRLPHRLIEITIEGDVDLGVLVARQRGERFGGVGCCGQAEEAEGG